MNEKVVITRPGGVDTVELVPAADPVPVADEVRIRVEAAGVAYGDVLLRLGLAGGGFPVIPGYDLVGIVEALGPGASTVRVGDRVAALPGTGAQQRLVCLPESELTPVPLNVSPEKAVSVVLNYTTAYQLLTHAAGLKRGDAAFIYGLTGGVGSAMRDVAGQLGIVVAGTASSGKLQAAKADSAIVFDRDDPDLAGSVLAWRPGGVQAVFDPVGGRSLGRSYRLLAPRGTLVMLGAASAVQGTGNARLKLAGTLARFLFLKLCPGSRRVALFLIMQSKKAHPDRFRRDLSTLLGWLEKGMIDPRIDQVLPLEQARHAHELLERSHVSGKIVLRT